MPSLVADIDAVKREILRYADMGRSPTNLEAIHGADAVLDLNDVLTGGQQRFYFPLIPVARKHEGQDVTYERYVWSFLIKSATLAVVSGTADYDLPDDFHDFVSAGFIYAGQTRVGRTTIETIEALRAQAPRNGAPLYFALRPKATPQGGVMQHEVMLYPTPGQNYSLSYRYVFDPEPLSDANPYHLGGTQHSRTFIAACLAEAESKLNDKLGEKLKEFQELLQSSIQIDRSISDAETVEVWPLENESTDLLVNKAYLKRRIGIQLGIGPHQAAWNHSEQQTVKLILETGLRKFYGPKVLPGERYAHNWSFLKPVKAMTLVSGQYKYDFPEGFVMLDGEEIVYEPGTAIIYPPIKRVAERQVAANLQLNHASSRPQWMAYRPKAFDEATGTRYEAVFWPVPDQEYVINYRCILNPTVMSEETTLPLGSPMDAQTLLEACLAAAEEIQGKLGLHSKLFDDCLAASISRDRKAGSADSLGFNVDRERWEWDLSLLHDCDENIVTYNGIQW
jgi:hypothetical protein